MAYKTIPVDEETYRKIQVLCAVYEMSRRSKGALVSKLVNKDYAALAAVKSLPDDKTAVAQAEALESIVE